MRALDENVGNSGLGGESSNTHDSPVLPSGGFRERLRQLQSAKGVGMDAEGALRQVQVGK